MKLFITVNMPNKIKEQIEKDMPNIKNGVGKANWVPKQNLHITMLFLGEVTEDKLSLIEDAMKGAVDAIEPFELFVQGIGIFPNKKRPRVLWGDVKGEIKTLQRLYDQLLCEIEKKEIPFDAKDKYTPHITLARKIENAPEGIELVTESWAVNALELYQSVFRDGGVTYKKVKEISFTS